MEEESVTRERNPVLMYYIVTDQPKQLKRSILHSANIAHLIRRNVEESLQFSVSSHGLEESDESDDVVLHCLRIDWISGLQAPPILRDNIRENIKQRPEKREDCQNTLNSVLYFLNLLPTALFACTKQENIIISIFRFVI